MMIFLKCFRILPFFAVLSLVFSAAAQSAETVINDSPTPSINQAMLDSEISRLNDDVETLERDIALLEQDLLFPPLTRLQVYVSVATDTFFDLSSVALFVEGEEKSYHIYTEKEIAALRLGGIQRLWEGNVALGNREVVMEFVGTDEQQQKVVKSLSTEFEKTLQGHALEFSIANKPGSQSPQFSAKNWRSN